MLEKTSSTMTLTSIGVIIKKRKFWRYLSGESYKKVLLQNFNVPQ